MGLFSNLIDGFTGKAQEDAARAAHKQYTKGVDQATNQARGIFNENYNAALEGYQPLADQGQQYNAMLADLYGLNGAPAQGEAQNAYLNDPMRQGQLTMMLRGQDRAANASGLYNSGTHALAGERAAQGHYNDWMRGLQGQAAQGAGYVGNQAGLQVDKGNTIGNMIYSSGLGKAQSAAGMEQAVGASKGVFGNNLMGLAGLAVKAGTGGMFPGFGGK